MKKPLILLIALLTALPLAAQEPRPDTKADTVSTFNALDYSLQRRYINRGVPFDRKDWKAHTFATLQLGLEQPLSMGDYGYSPGVRLALGAGYTFTRLSTVRLTALLASARRKTDNQMLIHSGIDADHLLNLTSYVSGYDPSRFFESALVTGLGLHLSHLDGSLKGGVDAHLGFQFKVHPAAYIDFYAEPRIGIATTGVAQTNELGNWHNYDLLYGLQLGMNYHFKAWNPKQLKRRLDGIHLLDDTFVSFGMGVQGQLSRPTSDPTLMKSMGPQVQLSAGKWISPYVGLRASLYGAADTWHRQVVSEADLEADPTTPEGETFYESATYKGLRLEAMLNVLECFIKDSRSLPYGVNVLAGAEAGWLKKLNHTRTASAGYTGLTAALQLKYRVLPELSVFVEPRLSTDFYVHDSGRRFEGHAVKENYTDRLMSLSLGVELSRATEGDRLARSLRNEEWQPSYFVSGALGLNAPVQLKRYEPNRALSYAAAAAVGAYLTPLHGARLTADFTPFEVKLKHTAVKYNMVSIGVDYLMNLTNLMGGFDPDRRYDAHLVAGLVASMRLKPATDKMPSGDTPGGDTPGGGENPGGDTPGGDTPGGEENPGGDDNNPSVDLTPDEKPQTRAAMIGGVEVPDNLVKSRFFVAGELGLHLTYRVMPRLSVYVEPKVRFYGSELMVQRNVKGMDVMMQLQAGASWRF